MEIKVYWKGMCPRKYEIPEMTREQFDTIKDKKDTPIYVAVEGHVYYNEHTCLDGYAGTCRCMSHPKKSWREYFPETLSWGKTVFSI